MAELVKPELDDAQEVADIMRRSALLVQPKPVRVLLGLAADEIELLADMVNSQHRLLQDVVTASESLGDSTRELIGMIVGPRPEAGPLERLMRKLGW